MIGCSDDISATDQFEGCTVPETNKIGFNSFTRVDIFVTALPSEIGYIKIP